MKACPTCQNQYDDSFAVCPKDGSVLEQITAPIEVEEPQQPTESATPSPKTRPKVAKLLSLVLFVTLVLSVSYLVYHHYSHSGTAIVDLQSNPPGAAIIIDGQHAGVSPLRHRLSLGTHHVEFKLDGYQPSWEDIEVKADGHLVIKELQPAQ